MIKSVEGVPEFYGFATAPVDDSFYVLNKIDVIMVFFFYVEEINLSGNEK